MTPLADTEVEGRTVNLLFGLVNLLILLTLVAIGISSLIAAIAPSSWSQELTNHTDPLTLSSRAAFLGGTFISLGTVRLLGSRLKGVWHWARLRSNGELVINDLGVTVKHDGVLTKSVLLPWDSIEAITFDTGENHDTHSHWRRFPLQSRKSKTQEFLFATDAGPVPNSALITTRPTPPNMAIVLNQPVTLHNPHVAASDAAFPPEAKKGMPSRPPREETSVSIIFLRAADPKDAHGILSSSYKVRPIEMSDLPI